MLDEATDLVAEHLRQLDNNVTDHALQRVDIYLRGFLERLRLRGAIHHPLLDPYIGDGGRLWFAWGGRPDGLPRTFPK